MPRLVYSSEKYGQGATIELDSKERIVCSIAQMGVLVYLHDHRSMLRSILSNFWGARLYNQRDVYKNAKTAQALSEIFPKVAAPLRTFKNPVLTVFANAIWHCRSAAEVCTVLNEAAAKGAMPEVNKQVEMTVDEVVSEYGALIEEYPSAVLDTSMLPIPKPQMKTLLKSLYAKAATSEIRQFLAGGFVLLSQFQEDVGPTPISAVVNFKGKPTEAELAQLNKWLAWTKVTQADADSLAAEWDRFLAGEPI